MKRVKGVKGKFRLAHIPDEMALFFSNINLLSTFNLGNVVLVWEEKKNKYIIFL